MRKIFVFGSIATIILITMLAQHNPQAWWLFAIAGPLIALGIADMTQTKHTIRSNFPVVGWGRYLMEDLRPKLYQYFIESDTNGRPFNRVERSLVYQRAKDVRDTVPFGTQKDVYAIGYEWTNHSIGALDHHKLNQDPRVTIGGKESKPYSASILNISAMSYGSLSNNAVEALNKGAKLGDFAHNTGEGGVSPYHLKHGGDLIWQIGTGYFGCRAQNGDFCPQRYADTVKQESIKMVELKLSQGAKPGHGGILPAVKNTPEIAKIRMVEPHTTIASPPFHRAFNSPTSLLEFIQQLREVSGGKPVGFKLCLGQPAEFLSICQAMLETGIKPDFITVDGGEGGTGAAPVEFSNSVGMPYKEGLAFIHDALTGYNLRQDITLTASGRIISAFDIFRALALGADTVNSARGMMLALGCIQALQCNSNECPVGVTTHKKDLVKGLDVTDKGARTYNFHKGTIDNFLQLLAAAGLEDPSDISRKLIYRRVEYDLIKRFDQLYPGIPEGSLLEKNWPTPFVPYQDLISTSSFAPHQGS